ncbi:MAG: hypothetical protein ABSA83_17005 [Verrucomicrobiota bacterium]|jgi:hypothetical protein
MDQTAHNRLTALAETYKKQQFKLTKPEIEEAANLLAQALLTSVGPAHDTVDAFIRALPADSTTKALGDSWLQLPDATKNHLLNTLPNLPRSDRFDRLKILAAAAILDVDPPNALTLLCSSCSSLAPRSGSHFSGEVVQVFRKTFLDGDEPKIQKLAITAHPSVVTAALLNLIISSLLGSSPLAPVFQLPTVKWFFNSQAYNRLKPAHQTQLVEAIKRWDTTLQNEVHKALDLLPSGLPPGFEFLLAPPSPKEPSPQPGAAVSPQPAVAILQPEKLVLHWKDLLAELTSQITKLDQDLLASNEQVTKSQDENQKLRASLANAEIHIQNLRNELAKKADESERTAQGLSAAQSRASEAKQRAEGLEALVAELKRNHEQEVTILASRVETETAQRLDTFKHDLARVLRVDYADFKMTNGKPMTLDLGEALRDLLVAIFDHLQKQGINVKD